jgi:hypothetical protein
LEDFEFLLGKGRKNVRFCRNNHKKHRNTGG